MVEQTITELLKVILSGTFGLIEKHGLIVGILALLGLFSIIFAVFNKLFEVTRTLFYFFIALPLVLILGLIRKSERKERMKEMGEIRAFLKEKPDRFKKLVYYILMMLSLVVFCFIVYWLMIKFLYPFYQFNEFTKNLNYTNITSNNGS